MNSIYVIVKEEKLKKQAFGKNLEQNLMSTMKRNVLIVEDDPAMRVLIKLILIESSLKIGEIYEAENGSEGLDILNKHHVDILLVDIYMPVMDGMEMMEYVSDNPDWRDIPAVIISTENDEERIDAIVRKGLGFVHKPLTMELLENQIIKMAGR